MVTGAPRAVTKARAARNGLAMAAASGATEVATFCPLCVSRCGARATVTDGTFRLDPDPSHPTGKALCVKGKAAPEITAHPERLRYPLKRTAPKGTADPGWQRIGWEEALSTVADRLRTLAREHGPECEITRLIDNEQVGVASSS